MTVALLKYSQTPNALAQAIAMCDGFKKLKPNHKVLIKPNIGWGLPNDTSPSKGLVVSAEIVEQLVMLLRDYGCSDITVGEGPLASEDLGTNAATAFAWSGVDKLAEKMGFRLLDLYQHPSEVRDFEGVPIRISRLALEADFFINLGLLRTHFVTAFSGAMKNLMGCIFYESKMEFHKSRRLERFIALLGKTVRNDLVVIDGVWAQQQAPSTRRVHHTDLVIASTDMLDNDIVCANLVGIDPKEVKHLVDYAELTGRSLDLAGVQVKGERVEEVKKPLPWVWEWPSEMLSRYGVRGLTVQQPGISLCSSCYTAVLVVLPEFLRQHRGTYLDNAEFVCGWLPRALASSKTVVLAGDCAIEAHKGLLPDAIRVEGCPPASKKMKQALDQCVGKKPESRAD